MEIVIPDTNKEFTLESDDSYIGIGVVLKQDGNASGYITISLNKAERSYDIPEKEL
jgi:hypothetical protein